MEKHSPTDDAPRSDEQQEHERDAERLMLHQEAEHLAHAKYRADSEAGLDRRRVAVPDLATSTSCPAGSQIPERPYGTNRSTVAEAVAPARAVPRRKRTWLQLRHYGMAIA
jgi:hypothetical protein